MRSIAIFVVIVIVLIAIGWIGFPNSAINPSVEFRTDKAKSDVTNAIKRVEDTVNDAKSSLQNK